jgi:UDP-N-acetylmuramoylalanine--D-glutamate ligase
MIQKQQMLMLLFFALDSMNTPTVWIVGWCDKGNDYNEPMSLV